ncbi:hypothetical protein [Clostridium estertheticum]|uniref:Uncharacterized protein n=1 Tax=Clostridium estertheticum subsp. estertheticum TaxID=1552 RepID=A0A1J0GEG9_9CLOT|nr:hypothetical protein [Clostridium estertheticum]APC39655.1 hypothetical protein A7L45_06035 [Clostridium estertheticum subsp. estertheticum]MBZ9614307.1 hypothetical protein [Clostridium estertheticum subsp. laramiense]WAG74245.1 hypothetical protein LL032_01955 [Clostridium estertheticum]
MIFLYKYRLKRKDDFVIVKLNSLFHDENIKKALEETFDENLISATVYKNYYEFRLNKKAKQGELRAMGRRIAKLDSYLNSIKQKYEGSNQLFKRIHTSRSKYYALLESVTQIDKENYRLIFDATFDIGFLNNDNDNYDGEEKINILRNLEGFTLELILPKFKAENILTKYEGNIDFQLYNWYILDANYENKEQLTYGANIYFSRSLGEMEEENIEEIKKVEDEKFLTKIDNYFDLKSLDFKVVEGEIFNGSKLSPLNIESVSIFNVGQGSCAAICDSEARPILYFDFGEAYGQDKQYCPINQRFCLCNNPYVILSHWDKDHWFGALRFNKIIDNKWIVPYQKIGVEAYKLADSISAKGNLFLWEDTKKELKTSFGYIFKCKGKANHRHNNGLGIFVEIKKEDNMVKKYLLPGDNRYRYIDSKFLHDLDGLVASHHGGIYFDKKSDISTIIPKNTKNGKIVYSAGDNSSHGHPSRDNDYLGRGWIERLDTKNGHCVLGLDAIKLPNCKGMNCDLEIKQI